MSDNQRQIRRNERIRERVHELSGDGYSVEMAIRLAAEEYYLSPATVRDIVYDRRRA